MLKLSAADRRDPRPVFPALPIAVTEILLHGYGPSRSEATARDVADAVSLLSSQRLAPLALQFCRDNRIELGPETQRQLRSAAFDQSVSTQRMVLSTVPALAALRRHQVPFLLTKGQGIAVHHPRITDRPFTDIDIILPRGRLRGAQRVLMAEAEYAEAARSRLPRASVETWCREAVNLEAPAGGRLDLHHRIPPWIWGSGLSYRLLSAHAGPVALAGSTFDGVSTEHNLLIAALHVVSDKNQAGANLMAWRDVIVLGHQVDPKRAALAAREAGLAAWLRWVLLSVPTSARPTPLVAELQAAGGRVPHRLRLRLIRSSRLRSRSTGIHMLRLPARNAVLYVLTLVFPSGPFLRAKYPDDPTKLYRRWWKDSIRL